MTERLKKTFSGRLMKSVFVVLSVILGCYMIFLSRWSFICLIGFQGIVFFLPFVLYGVFILFAVKKGFSVTQFKDFYDSVKWFKIYFTVNIPVGIILSYAALNDFLVTFSGTVDGEKVYVGFLTVPDIQYKLKQILYFCLVLYTAGHLWYGISGRISVKSVMNTCNGNVSLRGIRSFIVCCIVKSVSLFVFMVISSVYFFQWNYVPIFNDFLTKIAYPAILFMMIYNGLLVVIGIKYIKEFRKRRFESDKEKQ